MINPCLRWLPVNSALEEFGIRNIITIFIMKAMHQYCINKFENERFTEYESELWYTSLGKFGAWYVCINVFWLGLGEDKG